jgi:hypothetical protein
MVESLKLCETEFDVHPEDDEKNTQYEVRLQNLLR